MKIEKISDNQIRCTLSHQDLVDRELKISELAYSSEKARTLFRDMMQQASYEFGFETDNIPLMIEAIPVSMETLILVITKVENPNELDDRLARFSLSQEEFCDNEYNDLSETVPEKQAESDESEDKNVSFELDGDRVTISSTKKSNKNNSFVRIFSFDDLDTATAFACYAQNMYSGDSKLYKNTDAADTEYYFVLNNDNEDNFIKICAAASEFGSAKHISYALASHIVEHCEIIINNNALQVLASL